MPSDFAIHSDLLVHWTGKDIDEEYQPEWPNQDHTEISDEAVEAYLERLHDILKYGLWMTDQPTWTTPNKVQVPAVPCVCFTELKLSQSRAHARQYGRLGIGVKRPFVFERDGRPVTYFEPRFGNDALLEQVAETVQDKRLLQFFKQMDTGTSRRLRYDYYSESKWRIVAHSGKRWAQSIVNPRETCNDVVTAYFASLPAASQNKLRYLVPLDGWHAAIVYPALKVKNRAQADGGEIQQLIRQVAKKGRAYRVEGDNLPIELDLDLCVNF